jgi:hypothetical protein
MVVPLFMYAGALLVGVQLGRALETIPDSIAKVRDPCRPLMYLTAACC